VSYGKVRVQSVESASRWIQAETDREGHYRVEVSAGHHSLEPGVGRGEPEKIFIEASGGGETRADLVARAPAGKVVRAGQGNAVKAGVGRWKGSR